MRVRVSLLLIVVIAVCAPVLAQKRNITEKDLFNFVWIGDPQVSPDGSRIAFVRVTVNDKKDGYNTGIWTVATANGETRQLTNGPRDTTPRSSPDGK
jgi:dipeptidyl aminopeptidase/acylaminoacyl peptidase